MQPSKKHIEFIRLVVSGLTQKEAYKLSVGKKGVSSQVAEVKGSQLAKKYAKEIQQERERLRKVVEVAQDKKVAEIAQKDIMSKVERLEYLTKIAKGEVKIKKPFVIAGKIMEYPSEPDHSDRMKAISELNKMEGDYSPIKTEIKTTSPIIIDWNGNANNTNSETKGS